MCGGQNNFQEFVLSFHGGFMARVQVARLAQPVLYCQAISLTLNRSFLLLCIIHLLRHNLICFELFFDIIIVMLAHFSGIC